MKNYVQRIVDVRPTLVLVEKTVSRIAQDMLLEHGITLVINVKSVSVFHIYSLKKIMAFKLICMYGRYIAILLFDVLLTLKVGCRCGSSFIIEIVDSHWKKVTL